MQVLPSPDKVIQDAPYGGVAQMREAVRRAAEGLDDRLLVIVGPCSVHDVEAVEEYAERLARLQSDMGDRLLLVLRAHFEKPRTSLGWKGFLYDPWLDGSDDMAGALFAMRRLLVKIAEMGVPVATEFLEPMTPAYIGDLVSWATVGARTASSQIHRQMASGLEMAVGFKNTPEGDVETAVQGVVAARVGHCFPGIDGQGRNVLVRTQGNPWSYVVLRGGKGRPNYDAVESTAQRLRAEGLTPRIMVDCSHDNCARQPQRQGQVLRDVIEQRLKGQTAIAGLMLESHLMGGSQPVGGQLNYGVSVTDPCIDWATTESLLEWAYVALGDLALV
jgi:3-deoxy-7-phosphoheptulonate synthase